MGGKYRVTEAYFNPRPPEEVDVMWYSGRVQYQHFNPRPPEEVDYPTGDISDSSGISIHDLPRRSTGGGNVAITMMVFQSTTSRGGRLEAYL